jgi:DNA replication licensing factor MCM4
MKIFRDFLKGFKPKYRAAHDRELGLPMRAFATPEEAEVLLYETYLRRMRQTGDTNLNLDMANLLAYPPSKKLHSQLFKYPQEVIPAMDQVLKDLMLEIADMDQQAGMEGMEGAEGEEEIAEIMARIYKVRPFGLPSVNMRDLNPSGKSRMYLGPPQQLMEIRRHRQAGLHKRSRYSSYTRHSGHESRVFPLSHLFSHCPGRD